MLLASPLIVGYDATASSDIKMETKEFVPLLTGPHSETCVSPHLYRKALHRPGSLQSLSVQVGADSHRTALVMSPKP